MTCPLSITSGTSWAPASTIDFQAAARASNAGSAARFVSTPRSVNRMNPGLFGSMPASSHSSCSCVRSAPSACLNSAFGAGKVKSIRSVVPSSFSNNSNCPPSSSGELIAARPEKYFQRHHVSFAQRVNRRIRDLREALFAVIPERPAKAGHRSRRRIIAHAPDRFLSLFHQRLKQQAELIFAPAQRRHGRLRLGRGSETACSVGGTTTAGTRRNRANSFAQPQRIFGPDKLAARRIHQQNLSRPQPLPLGDFLIMQIGNSNL